MKYFCAAWLFSTAVAIEIVTPEPFTSVADLRLCAIAFVFGYNDGVHHGATESTEKNNSSPGTPCLRGENSSVREALRNENVLHCLRRIEEEERRFKPADRKCGGGAK